MPCMELFEEQDAAYKASVLTAGVPTLSVEAASVSGWERCAHLQIAPKITNGLLVLLIEPLRIRR